MAERYRRFTLSDRLEHAAQILAFTALALTGLVQRYSGAWISRRLIDLMGGIESVRIIHRVFATVLMVAVVYHVGAIGYRKFVLGRPREMIPSSDDLRAGRLSFSYIRGRLARPPRQGRFTWEEKLEYWSLVWGTVIMIITGFLLWNPIATSNLLPGSFIPAAKAAHSGEALLAVLAVLIWHSYHVHFKHFNKSMFTGWMSRAEMEHEHARELEEIESGRGFRAPSGPAVQRRKWIYLPVFAGLALVLLTGIYLFVTFEDTAIATVEPPEQVEVFAPVETTVAPVTSTEPPPPTETTVVPRGRLTWEDPIAGYFLARRCTDCHGSGMALAGLDLTDRVSTRRFLIPGDADGSEIVALLETGAHPTLLSDEQLALLRTWIDQGAP